MSSSGNGSLGSPCGACKFLRRRCATDCIFAPYFCSEQASSRFAAIHKVFGASNVAKLLLRVPLHERCEAVVTISYEAQARIRDPVYGCVAHIFALQQQVACLQAQLMQTKAQLGGNNIDIMNMENQQLGLASQSFANNYYAPNNYNYNNFPISPQSSLESSLDHQTYSNGVINYMQEMESGTDFAFSLGHGGFKKSTSSTTDLGELQALAVRMMKN